MSGFRRMTTSLIKIHQGQLIGRISKNLDGSDFYSFRGIPYARPPLGKLRFQAPQPPLPWKGVFEATKNGNCCYSKDLFSKKFVGSEDCLNLNVYTPTLAATTSQLLPVMVYIHGGGFTCGSNSSEIYGPEFLMTEKVVLVVINYRLGLLGFLNTKEIPGNAGFKDMVMALKWVQKNIEHFNGDPNNVTIFGTSAGGAAVHFLTLSPMSQGLFHKAILQSGCGLNPWSRGKNYDKEVFEFFGFREKILEHLENVPVEEILQLQEKIRFVLDASNPAFGLVIDHGEDAFMPQEPLNVISSKKFQNVPLMIGFAKNEGLVVESYNPARLVNILNNFESHVPHFLGYETGCTESKKVAKEIRKKYFGNQEMTDKNKNKFYKLVGDNLFVYGIYSAVRKHVENSSTPIYFYRMSLETSLRFFQFKESQKGAAHCDDIVYLFKTIFTPPLSEDSLEHKSIKKIVKIWTNFARCGNPTPVWESANQDKLKILDIDKELTLFDKFEDESLCFWDKIYSESAAGYKFVC